MIADWNNCEGGFKKTWFCLPNSLAIIINCVAGPFERLFGLPIVFCKDFIFSAKDNWQSSAAKAEKELQMKFRSLEEAWCNTIEGERALLLQIKQKKSPLMIKSNNLMIQNWQNLLTFDPIPALKNSGHSAIGYFVDRDLLNLKVGSIYKLWDLPEPRKILKKQLADGS